MAMLVQSRVKGIRRGALVTWMMVFVTLGVGSYIHGLGEIRDVPGFEQSSEIQGLGQFAVDEFNKQQNAHLSFKKVVRARQQVVAGIMYYLTIEAVDGDQTKIYGAKLLTGGSRPQNIQRLEEFKAMEHDDTFYAGTQEDIESSGWHTVPKQDPVVQDAAQNAVKVIQQRSNSLIPYELEQVLSAQTQKIKGLEKFNLLLEIKWGTKVEQYQVEMQRSLDGKWVLNHVQHD